MDRTSRVWVAVVAATLISVIALALLAAGAVAHVPARADSYASAKDCKYQHPSRESYNKTIHLLKNHRPATAATKERVHKWATCVATRAKAHAVHEHVRKLWAWRHQYVHAWSIRLNMQPAYWIQWARNITFCESRWNRYASNGSHFSYFQFSAPTWRSASAGFNPPASIYDAIWEHQAVIAIHWAQVAGTSQWVCRG